ALCSKFTNSSRERVEYSTAASVWLGQNRHVQLEHFQAAESKRLCTITGEEASTQRSLLSFSACHVRSFLTSCLKGCSSAFGEGSTVNHRHATAAVVVALSVVFSTRAPAEEVYRPIMLTMADQ